MQLQPYLFFNGRCEEALDFYKKVFGAEIVMMMRMKESPEPHPPGMLPPGSENKIMHAQVAVGGAHFMASDGRASSEVHFQGFALSLAFPDEEGAKKAYDAVSKQGRVDMPLTKTFWSPCFGMVTDQFGVQWMITTIHSQ